MPNQGTKGKRERDQTTPTGTSGRRTPGGNEAPQGNKEAIPPQPDETPRRRTGEDDEDSGLGNRTTFR